VVAGTWLLWKVAEGRNDALDRCFDFASSDDVVIHFLSKRQHRFNEWIEIDIEVGESTVDLGTSSHNRLSGQLECCRFAEQGRLGFIADSEGKIAEQRVCVGVVGGDRWRSKVILEIARPKLAVSKLQ
jgi:hypothetical protein